MTNNDYGLPHEPNRMLNFYKNCPKSFSLSLQIKCEFFFACVCVCARLYFITFVKVSERNSNGEWVKRKIGREIGKEKENKRDRERESE